MKKHVVNEIVVNDLCSGCGVCAGVCPSKILGMQVKDNGDLAPDIAGKCPPKCVVCLDVCPFSDSAIDVTQLAQQKFTATEIRSHPVVGSYLGNYVGYSVAHRPHGASGGMLSWVLEALLRENLVDAVITVSSNTEDRPADGLLFQMTELTRPEDIRAAAGSFYYPISVAKRLRSIQDLKEGKRYALVGLPCTLKGIALATRKIPSLRRSIQFTFGLVCGHLPNTYYTEYLSKLSGCNPESLGRVSYRGKNEGEKANNYTFQSESKGGDKGKAVPFYGSISSAWTNRQFQLNACNFCDDLFAEVADASFMDAWLPQYMNDHRGHSIVTVRNPVIRELIDKGIQRGECVLDNIEVTQAAKSQETQWAGKSVRLSGQLAKAQKAGRKIPPLRQQASEKTGLLLGLKIALQNGLQETSKEVWPVYINKSLWRYHLRIMPYEYPLKLISIVERFDRVVRNPEKIISKISLFRKKNR